MQHGRDGNPMTLVGEHSDLDNQAHRRFRNLREHPIQRAIHDGTVTMAQAEAAWRWLADWSAMEGLRTPDLALGGIAPPSGQKACHGPPMAFLGYHRACTSLGTGPIARITFDFVILGLGIDQIRKLRGMRRTTAWDRCLDGLDILQEVYRT